MSYSMHLLLTLATVPATPTPSGSDPSQAEPTPADVIAPVVQQLLQLAEDFRRQPVSPARTQQFEQQLCDELRALGRRLVQWTYNHLEPAGVGVLAKHVRSEAGLYTRLNRKTPQHAWTLFGPILLWRVGYRPTDKGGEPTLFPLALGLGLVQGAPAALAGRAALAESSGTSSSEPVPRASSLARCSFTG